MNRAHDSKKAIKSIEMAKKYFENISIDIYMVYQNQV